MADENGYVDEETLEEYADEIETREVAPTGLVRTRPPFPTDGPGDGRTWAEYFREVRRGGDIDRAVAAKRQLVLCVDPTPSEDGLGRSPKSVLKAVRDAGWPRVELHSTIVAVSDEFYAADSKKKPGEEAPANRKGDLKTPAHIDRHWFLVATYPAGKIGFAAHWTEGTTPKGGRSFGFGSAIATDPLGVPTEFFYDYAPDANARKQVKDEPGHIYEGRLALMEAAARRRDREYNDGISWLNTRPRFAAFKEFESWLDEAIIMTTPREVADV